MKYEVLEHDTVLMGRYQHLSIIFAQKDVIQVSQRRDSRNIFNRLGMGSVCLMCVAEDETTGELGLYVTRPPEHS
jgi:hypothetical protein